MAGGDGRAEVLGAQSFEFGQADVGLVMFKLHGPQLGFVVEVVGGVGDLVFREGVLVGEKMFNFVKQT